jgi:hypothetical protein
MAPVQSQPVMPALEERRGSYQNVAPRPAGYVQHCKLTLEEKQSARELIVEYIKKEKLHPVDDNGDLFGDHPQITKLLTSSKDGGEGSTLKTIKRQYEAYWKELYRFSVKVCCVATMTIMSDDLRPKNPLPANPDTIQLWWAWKTTPQESCVSVPNTGGGTSATWADGSPMMGCGSWNASVNLRRARTAIQMVHAPFEHCRGVYTLPCDDCLSANQPSDGDAGGLLDFTKGRAWLHCGYHTAGSALRVRGDPTLQKNCSDFFNGREKYLDSTHDIRGNVQLTACQVRQLRSALLNTGMRKGGLKTKLKNLQTYLMLLLGIKLFLRADEVVTLQLSQFRTDCAIVDKEVCRIDRLVVWVKGKTDKKPVNLCLYRDDENPEFCPIRHLMAYLAYTNIDSGYLFPAWPSELLPQLQESKNVSKWEASTHVSYRDFLDRVQVSTESKRLIVIFLLFQNVIYLTFNFIHSSGRARHAVFRKMM